jgi:hypothetical protein
MSMRISPVNVTSDPQPATPKPAESQKSGSEIQEAVIGYPFSTRVGSTTYSGNVEKFANEFHGSVSGLLGVTATGSSVNQVEEHLSNLISFFA